MASNPGQLLYFYLFVFSVSDWKLMAFAHAPASPNISIVADNFIAAELITEELARDALAYFEFRLKSLCFFGGGGGRKGSKLNSRPPDCFERIKFDLDFISTG
jgi:hypothetical protein